MGARITQPPTNFMPLSGFSPGNFLSFSAFYLPVIVRLPINKPLPTSMRIRDRHSLREFLEGAFVSDTDSRLEQLD